MKISARFIGLKVIPLIIIIVGLAIALHMFQTMVGQIGMGSATWPPTLAFPQFSATKFTIDITLLVPELNPTIDLNFINGGDGKTPTPNTDQNYQVYSGEALGAQPIATPPKR